MSSPIRLAVVCDFPEEDWPSMDLVGAMILSHLGRDFADQIHPTRVCPPFRHRLARRPIADRLGSARNADRLLNRFWDYPRALARQAARDSFDLYHIVDHSYAQLVHAIPPERAVVTCHDLDTFRCLLEPQLEPRPRWFRAMAQRILDGLCRAAAIVCDSEATRAGLLRHALVPADRLHVVFLGTHPECSPDAHPEADAEAARHLGPLDLDAAPEILHVGSTIPRKRLDVVLATFAAIQKAKPGARLVRVGGALTPAQREQAAALGIVDAIATLPFLSRSTLAAVYRRAALVLLPSEAEGFGLPVAEALACGAPLLASDLTVLREVGGDAAVYCPVADLPAWCEAAFALLGDRRCHSPAWQSRRAAGIERARRFTWSSHVQQLAVIYRQVLGGKKE
jgi:glycosyltransferase involved in cell wall biosynthesis